MGEVCRKMNGDRSLKHAILSLHGGQRSSQQILSTYNTKRVKLVQRVERAGHLAVVFMHMAPLHTLKGSTLGSND